jgi:hypothetical protein
VKAQAGEDREGLLTKHLTRIGFDDGFLFSTSESSEFQAEFPFPSSNLCLNQEAKNVRQTRKQWFIIYVTVNDFRYLCVFGCSRNHIKGG